MPNTPPQLVRTAAGAGWTNPTKITGTSGQAIRALAPNGTTPALTGTNCGFAIPAGATIAGVIVTANVQGEADFELGYSIIQLVNGAAIGTAKSDPASWRAAGNTVSYGSPTDLWGAALTPAIVNSASFGFTTVVQNFSFSNPETASVNGYTVQVFYSFGGGGGSAPSNGGIPAPLNMLLIPAFIQVNQFSFFTLDPTNFNDPNSGSFYNWKVEDVIAGRTATVRRVIISYRDLGVARIMVSLSGVTGPTDSNQPNTPVSVLSPLTTIGTVNATGKICTLVLGLELSAANLQLSVIRSANGGPVSITKARLEGSVETTVY